MDTRDGAIYVAIRWDGCEGWLHRSPINQSISTGTKDTTITTITNNNQAHLQMRVDERQQLRLHAGGRRPLLAGRHPLLMLVVSFDAFDWISGWMVVGRVAV